MTVPIRPGLKSRREQLQARLQDLAEARAERDVQGPQGTIDAKKQVRLAQSAAKRQENVAQGKPALDDDE